MAIIVPIVSAWNPAGLNRALKDIQRAKTDFDKFVAGTSSIGKSMSNVGKSLSMNVTLPLTLVGAASIRTAADFEVAMAQVAVATDTPVSGLKNLSDLAKQLGADTIFSANEAAQAMLELAKAGITPAEISSGALANTLDLAAASGMALAESAVVMSAGMNTFNLGAKDSVSIVDALAGAANASAADVSDIALALQQTGQQAVASGLTIQETTAALAAFADAGVRGSDAGTSFKTFLQRLNPVSAEAAKTMKQLGIEFFDSSGNMKDLTGIAGEVEKGFKGLTQEQRLAAMQTIFGSDALRAANILYTEGADGIAKYIKASSLSGAAADMAAARNSGLSGSLEKLKGSMETAALVIGEVLAPTIMRVAEALQNFFNGFAKLNPVTQKAIIFFGGLLAVLGPVLFIFGAFIGSLANIAKLMGTVNLLMGTNIGLFKGTAFAAGQATAAVTIFGRAIRIAIASTGIGLLIVGIAELIILMTGLGDATTVTANKSVIAGARMRNSFAGVQDEIDATRKKNSLLQKELALGKQESRDAARSEGRNNAPARITSITEQLKDLNLEFNGVGGSGAKATKVAKELSKETQAAMARLGNELKSRSDQLDAIKEKFKSIKNAVKEAITGVINFGAAQGASANSLQNALDAQTALTQAQLEYDQSLKAGNIEAVQIALENLQAAQTSATNSITKKKSFLEVLQDQAALATQFADKVKTLISLGLSESAIGQVLAAGAEAGTAIADEIIAGGATVVTQVNSLVEATASVAEAVGEAAGKQFYQAGIDAGQALVDGVRAAIAAAGFSIGIDGNITAPTQDAEPAAAAPSGPAKKPAKKPAATPVKAPKPAINQGLLNKFKNIPMMAAGGIVNTPTLAMIGEAGPEAVIPLTGNNMPMGATYNININAGMGADGAVIGREIVDMIKRYERVSGPVFASA
jgi:TP901 family phage tail tape measure protein